MLFQAVWQWIRKRQTDVYLCLALALATFAAYEQVAQFDFVNYDDPSYITGNLHLRSGISVEGLRWAWTSGELGHWIPVVRMSELLDYQLFGLRSGPPHLVNLAWHVLATLFLFAFLHRATGARWRSAAVAALFALHPLHVESVAWVTERKDVLSAFFFFLALWAYVRYVERPSNARYLLAIASFCFGLMSKSMVVTLPLVLVMLDFWPLRRWTQAKTLVLLKEKIPFAMLSAAACIVAFATAHSVGALADESAAPLSMRVGNALVSYTTYLGKTLWPVNLATFYPYPKDLPVWQAILAALALAGFTIMVLRNLRHRPFLAVGWFWFLMTLLPVIGLVQNGSQAYADRFMYLPMIGLLIMLVWWLPAKPVVTAAVAGVCLAAAAVSWIQTGYWRDSESLFRHALAVTDDNYLSHYELGVFLAEKPGGLPQAIEQYQAALRIRPSNVAALNNLGAALSKTPGHLDEAIADYQAVLRIRPDYVQALNNLGVAYSQLTGHLPDAIAAYQAALRIKPDDGPVHRNLGQAFARMGQWPESVVELETAVRIDPANGDAHNELAAALTMLSGRLPDVISQYREAARLKVSYADDAGFHRDLGNALARSGRMPEAIAEYQAALRLRPDFAEAHNNLGFALVNLEGRIPEAIEQFETALRIQPDYRDAQNNLELALKLQRTVDQPKAAR